MYPISWKRIILFAKFIGGILFSTEGHATIGLLFSIHRSRKGPAESRISVLHSSDYYFSTNTMVTYIILLVSSISKYYPSVNRILICGSLSVPNLSKLFL